MFSSAREDWTTPRWLFDQLAAEFHFTLDAAASASNALCAAYYTPAQDALRQPWAGAVWCNPPYGRAVGRWVAKGFTEAMSGSAAVVVMLVAARTDTRWWHDCALHGREIRFIPGRLRFGGHSHPAPFPSAVLIFAAPPAQSVRVSSLQPIGTPETRHRSGAAPHKEAPPRRSEEAQEAYSPREISCG